MPAWREKRSVCVRTINCAELLTTAMPLQTLILTQWSKMVPSLKSTSLSAAEFEDRVAASMLLRMMLDEYLHDQSHGRIVRIQWGRLDWLPFDDLVVTTEDSTGCKSCLRGIHQVWA